MAGTEYNFLKASFGNYKFYEVNEHGWWRYDTMGRFNTYEEALAFWNENYNSRQEKYEDYIKRHKSYHRNDEAHIYYAEIKEKNVLDVLFERIDSANKELQEITKLLYTSNAELKELKQNYYYTEKKKFLNEIIMRANKDLAELEFKQ